jgi:hypothetical protein
MTMNLLPIQDLCTLPTAALPARLMEFDELFRRQVMVPRRIGPHRVEFTFASADGVYAQVSDLVARESVCCSFFEFTIDQRSQLSVEDQLVLRVGVPEKYDDVLDALMDRAVAAIDKAGR